MHADDWNDYCQEVILDHSRRPRNFREMPEANRTAVGDNPLCGDQVRLFLRIDGNVVLDLAFQGAGCAISQASASLLTCALKGQTIEESRALFERVREMVSTGVVEETGLGALAAFGGVHRFPIRIKCATLPWHTFFAAVDGSSAPVSTE